MQIGMTRVLMPAAQLGALALHLAIGYLYVVSGLVVPGVFLFLLWAAWGALLIVGFQHRHDFRYLVAVPLLATIIWTGIVLGLGWLLNWQA